LRQAYKGPVVFHNGKFDLDVAQVHFNLPTPPHHQWHDTMLLAYLYDPHSRAIGLKQQAEIHLGTPATERDELKAWVLANVKEAKKGDWGAYISKAPGDLVGRYAAGGDAEMTLALYEFFMKELTHRHGERWKQAYEREKRMVPLLIKMEERGVKIDLPRLRTDLAVYEKVLVQLEQWIQKRLGVKSLNLESADEIADALEQAGQSTGFLVTATGKRSTSKASIAQAVQDNILALALDYRSTLATYLQTFMRKWVETAENTGGRIYTQWNSTKQAEGGGTRTGRLSSTPNLMNIPSDEKREEQEVRYTPLHQALAWLPPLPQMKLYVVAESKKRVLLNRDFSQQEPRILGHFTEGNLMDAYQRNPLEDVYIMMLNVLAEMGIVIDPDPKSARKKMKALVLAIIYGLGVGKLADKLGCTVGDAKQLRAVFFMAFPEIQELQRDMKRLAANNECFYTWGGRPYFCEPPIVHNGKRISFEYKMVNYLIQPSAADITKETMLRVGEQMPDSELVLTVHDELLTETESKLREREMNKLREIMESIELDVLLTSDGAYGYSWGDMKECA
jgi:DNA polymerase-1